MTETAITAETAKTVKTAKVASLRCILEDKQKEGNVLSRAAKTVEKNRQNRHEGYPSPLPNISTLAIRISPRKSPPNHQNGVAKMNFPEFPGSRVSVEIL